MRRLCCAAASRPVLSGDSRLRLVWRWGRPLRRRIAGRRRPDSSGGRRSAVRRPRRRMLLQRLPLRRRGSPDATPASAAARRPRHRTRTGERRALLRPNPLRAESRRGLARRSVRKLEARLLLIHGLADDETPPHHLRAIAAAAPGNALWLVPHARHVSAYAVAPEEYRARILGWFQASR